MMTEKLNIFFYGNDFIPLADECYGCHHFNFVCGGSVTTDVCPTGDVENMSHSVMAYNFLADERVNHNNFLLARANGEDLKDEHHLRHIRDLEIRVAANAWIPRKKDYVEALQKTIADYQVAVTTEESIVSELKETHFIELHIQNCRAEEQKQEKTHSSEGFFIRQNPSDRPMELDEDDLPF